nr:DNA-processing protein DprA [Motilibacter aurantiacus]
MAARAGARLVVPGDREWPPALHDLRAGRPLALWVRGAAGTGLAAAVEHAVAVVGARAATAYGLHVAATLSAQVAARGWTVVSGGAFGIDAAAHRGALSVGGTTVAVLACGVDVAYPRAHEPLLSRVAQDGVLVSEVPPGTGVTRGRFLERNRLLAALSRGTVVVEAALRSGARSTAERARELCREVMAVPGPVTSPLSAGCHEEVRARQAALVTDGDDVLDIVGQLGVDSRPERRAPPGPLDVLDPEDLRVYDAMPLHGAVPAGQLARASLLPVPDVLGRLGRMAVQGLVEATDRGWRRAVPTARRHG